MAWQRRTVLLLLCFMFASLQAKEWFFEWDMDDPILDPGPDGRRKHANTVGGTIPAPLINVTYGDVVSIQINNVGHYNVTLHWHGIDQRGTNEMDGVDGVTQCSIPPGRSFTYKFTCIPAGTMWYHSHSGMQYSDGSFGAFIVQDPPGNNIRKQYDEELLVIFNDWFGRRGEEYIEDMQHGLFTGGAVSDIPWESGLVNGKGRFDPVNNQSMPLEVITVKKGKTYRLRTINACSSFGVRFSIDQHMLEIIQNTADYVTPSVVDSAVSYMGERLDFLLRATEEVDNYWMRFETANGRIWRAILRYEGADDVEPPEPAAPPSSSQAFRLQKYYQLYGMTNESDCCDHGHWPNVLPCCTAQMGEFHTPVLTARPPTLPPPAQITTNVTLSILGSMKPNYFIFFNKVIFSLEAVNIPVIYTRGDFGILPNKPYEPPLPYPPEHQFIYDGLEIGTNVVKLGHNEVVQMVINNQGPMAHPVHLHGHRFYSLGIGPENITDVGEEIGDPHPFVPEEDTKLLNLVNPPLVDTIVIPAKGWGVVRWTADNPGAWICHCHIDAHLDTGMIVVFVEDVPSAPQTTTFLETCVTNNDADISSPTNLHVSAFTETDAHLAWDEPRKGNPFFYRVAIRKTSDDDYSYKAVDMRLSKNTVTARNLIPDVEYEVYVEVTNFVGNTKRSYLIFTFVPPSRTTTSSSEDVKTSSTQQHTLTIASGSSSNSSSSSFFTSSTTRSSSSGSSSTDSSSGGDSTEAWLIILIVLIIAAVIAAVVTCIIVMMILKRRQAKITVPRSDMRHDALISPEDEAAL